MPEGLSDPAEKVFKAMIHAGLVSEDKMKDAQGITNMSKIPKAQCMNWKKRVMSNVSPGTSPPAITSARPADLPIFFSPAVPDRSGSGGRFYC